MKIKWSKKNQILFFERLATYLYSLMSINDAIKNCGVGLRKRDKKIIEVIGNNISLGLALSYCLNKEIVVSKTIIGIIQVGERSGKLSEAMVVIKNLLEREDELKKKVVSALIYPCVIGVFATLLVIGLVRGVIPQITPMLKGLNIELPFLTKAVICISDLISKRGLYIILVLIIILPLFTIIYRRSDQIKVFFHSCIYRIPIVGLMILNVSLSIFLRSFGSMLSTGISIQEAFNNSVVSIDFLPLKIKMKKLISQISNGKKVSDCISQINMKISPFVIGLLSAGEKSGTLDVSSIRIADILDRDIDHSLKRLTSLLEPLLMILMGLIIGAIALSIVMPIYDISKTLQR